MSSIYRITDGNNYIGMTPAGCQTAVKSLNKAIMFNEKQKAINYLNNLKATLRKFDWSIVAEEIDDKKDISNIEDIEYEETELEKSGFDISKFFSDTIKTISQLRDYAKNMGYIEQEYNKKILDTRHYIRDEKTKLNAIQMQRIGYFLQQLERERYESKSNRMIAEIFLADLKRMENINYIEVVKNVKESEYVPEILTYEMLDKIAGRRAKKINRYIKVIKPAF